MRRTIPLLFLFALLFSLSGVAQTPGQEKEKHKRIKSKYVKIYKPNTKKAIWGSPCALEESHKMGFEYYLGCPTNRNYFYLDYGMINLVNRVYLTFRNGPFWSIRLKRRIKECRYRTGDYNGF